MNRQINQDNLQPGDIIVWRDKESSRQVVIDGKIFGNWEDAVLYLGNNKVLWGGINHCHPLPSFLSGDGSFGVFRATPPLTLEEQSRIIHVALDLAGLCLSWKERVIRYFKKLCGIKVFPKFGYGVNSSTELIASGYEAAGRKICSMVPWKVELHHIDGSTILVRVF